MVQSYTKKLHPTFRTRAVVTLWGKYADALDADRLQRWPNDEPVVLLFVGMTIDEFNGKYFLLSCT